MKNPKSIKLNLGCGIHLYSGYINVDKFYTLEQLKSKKAPFQHAIIEKGAQYVQADIEKLPFPDNYADEVELMDTIEHFPMFHVTDYLKEIYRVMKPGATLTIETTYFTGLCLDWIRSQVNHEFNPETYLHEAEVFYGNQRYFGEFHLTPFTPDFLNWCLVMGGFKDGKMQIYRQGSMYADNRNGRGGRRNPKSVFRNDMIVAVAHK